MGRTLREYLPTKPRGFNYDVVEVVMISRTFKDEGYTYVIVPGYSWYKIQGDHIHEEIIKKVREGAIESPFVRLSPPKGVNYSCREVIKKHFL